MDTNHAFVRRLTDIIGKRSLLDPETAQVLAKNIAKDLDMSTENATVQGADYLGGLEIYRYSTGWFKR